MKKYANYAKKLLGDRWRQMVAAVPGGQHGYSVWARDDELTEARAEDNALLRTLYVEFDDDYHIVNIDAIWYLRVLGSDHQWIPLIFLSDLQKEALPYRETLGASITYHGERRNEEWTYPASWRKDCVGELGFFCEWKQSHGQLSEVLSVLARQGVMTEKCQNHICTQCKDILNEDMPAWDLFVAFARALRGYGNTLPWTPSRKLNHVLRLLTAWEACAR